MYTVGITGGIGSGKTTIAKLWRTMGAYVLFADDLAKDLMVSDQDVIHEIRQEFGEQAYLEDGSLNKEYLREQVFSKNRVEELNRIVHPKVFERTTEKIEEAEQNGYDVFVKEAALLLKYGRPDEFNKIVLVLADEQKRIARVTERDGAEAEEVKARIAKQQDFTQHKKDADFVIYNNGTMEDLELRAKILYHKFKEQARHYK